MALLHAEERPDLEVEADGACIGTGGLFDVDRNARHAELGIGIRDKG